MNLQRIRVLAGKEFARLLRNPPALMAVGLLILMAFLLTIDNPPSGRPAAKADPRLAGCWIVYWEDDGFIPWLRKGGDGAAAKKPRHPVRFVPVDRAPLHDGRVAYPPGLNCAIEWRLLDDGVRPVTLVGNGSDEVRVAETSRWLLTAALQFYGRVEVAESSRRLPVPPDRRTGGLLGGIDLSGPQAQAMVGAMLLFSVQFFACCALFVSFTSHERERGILQALALTTASVGEILAAKYLFHLALSAVASATMVCILKPAYAGQGGWWLLWLPVWLFNSIGLLAVATLVAASARTQTAASLFGFCYLMGVGIVFALSKNFPAFGWVRSVMFENYGFLTHHALLGAGSTDGRGVAAVLLWGTLHSAVLATLLLAVAVWIFRRRGWRAA